VREEQDLHSGEDLNPLPLGAVCFLQHHNYTVCSVGRLLLQSAASESKQATSMVLVCKDKTFYGSRFTYRGRELARSLS